MNPQIQNPNGTKTELKRIPNDTKFKTQVEYNNGVLKVTDSKKAKPREWGAGGTLSEDAREKDFFKFVMGQVLKNAMKVNTGKG